MNLSHWKFNMFFCEKVVAIWAQLKSCKHKYVPLFRRFRYLKTKEEEEEKKDFKAPKKPSMPSANCSILRRR